MTVSEQLRYAREFVDTACRLLESKSTDYAPHNVVLYDLVKDASALGQRPEIALYLMMKKHVSAIERWVYYHDTSYSEPIQSRLLDLVNFCALMGFLETNRDRILTDVIAILNHEPCECQLGQPPCTRCRARRTLAAETLRSFLDLSTPSTQRQLDFSPGDAPDV